VRGTLTAGGVGGAFGGILGGAVGLLVGGFSGLMNGVGTGAKYGALLTGGGYGVMTAEHCTTDHMTVEMNQLEEKPGFEYFYQEAMGRYEEEIRSIFGRLRRDYETMCD